VRRLLEGIFCQKKYLFSRSFLFLIASIHFDSGLLGVEIEDFKVLYATNGVDDVFTNEKNQTVIRRLSNEDLFTSGHFLTTGAGAYAELKGRFPNLIRIGSDSVVQCIDFNHWKIFEGSALFCLENDYPLVLSCAEGSVKVDGLCTFIVQCTSNGGFKFISLSGTPSLSSNKVDIVTPGGRLVLFTGGESVFGNAYDIDLLLILQTSLLVSAFENPLPTIKKVGLSVFAQQKKLKGKYNALIGDAKSNKDLQMYILGNK